MHTARKGQQSYVYVDINLFVVGVVRCIYHAKHTLLLLFIPNFLLVCFTRFNKHNQLDIVTNANEIKTESGPNEYANTDW